MDWRELPQSFIGWIILFDSLDCIRNIQVFIKILTDYLMFLPAYKVSEICNIAHTNLTEEEFQTVIDLLWKYISGKRESDASSCYIPVK